MDKITYGKESDLNLKALVVLARCRQSVMRDESKPIKSAGLTMGKFAVLEVLYHKGDMRIKEIMAKILSTGGNMTVVVDNLEKDGLVRRIEDPTDRRAMLVRITYKGRDKIDEIFPDHLKNINKIFSVLSDEEKQQLISIGKKLGKSL